MSQEHESRPSGRLCNSGLAFQLPRLARMDCKSTPSESEDASGASTFACASLLWKATESFTETAETVCASFTSALSAAASRYYAAPASAGLADELSFGTALET